MSTNKLVISPELMRELDEVREAMESNILSGEIDGGDFDRYYSEYMGFRKCYAFIQNRVFNLTEAAEEKRASLLDYRGMETYVDGEEEEEED